MKLTSNWSNRLFDRVIDNSKQYLGPKVADACGYPSDILLDRLMQRLTEIALPSYASAVDSLFKMTSDPSPSEPTQINCGSANLEVKSGRITFTPMQWVRNQVEFLVHWAFCLFAITVVAKGRGVIGPTVLVFGIGEESLFKGESDEEFVSFCRSGPIDPLRTGKRFFVQSATRKLSFTGDSFHYLRHPLIGLLQEAKLGFVGRSWLLINHIIFLLLYSLAIFRLPELSLLGRDFAYSRVMFELDRRGLIGGVIFTNSNFMRQPLWSRILRGGNVHMVWNSQNFKPIIYKSDELDSDVPAVRWIRVDMHWVWTFAFAEYLTSLGIKKPKQIMGPILWYPPIRMSPNNNSIKIAIFDVSPYSDNTALRYGEIPNYNHPDNLLSFIRDLVSLRLHLEEKFDTPVSLVLKTKRGYNPAYDRAYFDHLGDLAAQGIIILEHHAKNMYSLISGSHLAIVYPYSSPAYVADFLNVPSIYYDPTSSISRHDFGDSSSLINFADSLESLFDSSMRTLSEKFSQSH